MDIDKYYKKISTYNLDKALVRVLKKLEAEIIDANILQHTELGVDSSGVSISSYAPYTQTTVFLKRLDNTLSSGDPTIVNLNDTESFHDKFKIIWGVVDHEITSTDSKTDELVDKYGDIFGLTDASLNDLKPAIMQLLIEDIKNV